MYGSNTVCVYCNTMPNSGLISVVVEDGGGSARGTNDVSNGAEATESVSPQNQNDTTSCNINNWHLFISKTSISTTNPLTPTTAAATTTKTPPSKKSSSLEEK